MNVFELKKIVPSSNVEVERGFSALKEIKIDARNRLLDETLDHLMMIDLNGQICTRKIN